MRAVKAHFDGKQIVLPPTVGESPAGDVIVVFEDSEPCEAERQEWMKLQEHALAKVWDNDEDAVYDSL